MRYCLGISAFYHDSAACLLGDGRIIAAAHEERFSRVKHDAGFPRQAVAHVLGAAGLHLADIECIAFYDKPYIKFERLLESYHAVAPAGFMSFAKAMPVWLKNKLFMKRIIREALDDLFPDAGGSLPPVVFPEHHLSHAASAFYPSPFEKAAILTVDGVGEWTTTSIATGTGNTITVHAELHFPHSVGLLYSAFTAYCGFKVNSGEYKLMGLAPYGTAQGAEVQRLVDAITREMVDIRPDGSIVLNMDYFDYVHGLRMYNRRKWEALFGFGPRAPESEGIETRYMDLALAIQQVTEDIVLRLAGTALDAAGSTNLCLAGGVALNCVASGRLIRERPDVRLWIQPAAGDAGGALGAAYAAWHIHMQQPRTPQTPDAMQGAYLGPDYDETAIATMLTRRKAVARKTTSFDALCTEVADLIAAGDVVGWFQGRMEYGPRALGNRSIIGDPRSPEMQKKLNLRIKFREGFRPFAPSVLEEHLGEWFDIDRPTPYMLLVAPVAPTHCHALPEGYASLPLMDKLYVTRSTIPAITHVDMSARIQSVSRDTNPRYWQLIDTFRQRHGCPVIVNTSFNVRGEPIVCTPDDAYLCFMRTDMDHLVLGDFILHKADQPPLSDDADWRNTYTLD